MNGGVPMGMEMLSSECVIAELLRTLSSVTLITNCHSCREGNRSSVQTDELILPFNAVLKV